MIRTRAAPIAVLLVEDDTSLAEMYRRRLEHDGFDVAVAPDGETALRLLGERLPDIVFLDLQLPRRHGLEILEAIRADDRMHRIPVTILTSYDDPVFRERGRELGALDYLIKFMTTPAQLSRWIADWARRNPRAAGPEAGGLPQEGWTG